MTTESISFSGLIVGDSVSVGTGVDTGIGTGVAVGLRVGSSSCVGCGVAVGPKVWLCVGVALETGVSFGVWLEVGRWFSGFVSDGTGSESSEGVEDAFSWSGGVTRAVSPFGLACGAIHRMTPTVKRSTAGHTQIFVLKDPVSGDGCSVLVTQLRIVTDATIAPGMPIMMPITPMAMPITPMVMPMVWVSQSHTVQDSSIFMCLVPCTFAAFARVLLQSRVA